MNIKLMLSYKGTSEMRKLAQVIHVTMDELKQSIDHLLICSNQIDNLGIHRQEFIQLLYACRASLITCEEVSQTTSKALLYSADCIEQYLDNIDAFTKARPFIR